LLYTEHLIYGDWWKVTVAVIETYSLFRHGKPETKHSAHTAKFANFPVSWWDYQFYTSYSCTLCNV